jgi:hypothetical protein
MTDWANHYANLPIMSEEAIQAVYKGGSTMYLTYENALEVLQKAVADRGAEFVYTKRSALIDDGKGGYTVNYSCLYWHSDEEAPGCLVGLALHKLGVSGEALARFGAFAINRLAEDRPSLGGVVPSPDALHLLSTVQAYQDRGAPWGEALIRAVQLVEARRQGEACSLSMLDMGKAAGTWQLTSV